MITGREGFIGSHLPAEDIKGVIIHLDAITGINEAKEDPNKTFQRNVAQTAYLVDAARRTDQKLVFASSAAAANPTNPYAASKALCETWCQAYAQTYGVYVSILRFANVYGPGSMRKTSCVAMMCKDAIQTGKITVEGDGKQTRDLVYVEDVCQAILLHPEGLWSVRTGRQTPIIDVAEMIAELSGAKIELSTNSDGGAESSLDAAPRIEAGYMQWERGVEITWEWFVENFKPA